MEFSKTFLSLWSKPSLMAKVNFNIVKMLASLVSTDLHPGLLYDLKTIVEFSCLSCKHWLCSKRFHDTLEFFRYSNLYTYFLRGPFETATVFSSFLSHRDVKKLRKYNLKNSCVSRTLKHFE